MTIKNGAVIWARQTMESEIFSKPDKWFKIWFYLVCMANHTDKGRFKRGQCFLAYELIMLKCKATKSEVDHCIRWLKKSGMLATEKATRGFIVTICNYDIYQTLDHYKGDTKSDREATEKRQRSDTINKNVKNDKNENKQKSYVQFSKSQFWVLYPRKESKLDAEKAWKSIRPDNKLNDEIVAAVALQVKAGKLIKGDKYTPMPASWLRAGKWKDEIVGKQEVNKPRLIPPVCVVDHKPAQDYRLNGLGKPVFLCDECRDAIGKRHWGKMSFSEIERAVEKGNQRPLPARKDPALATQDKKQATLAELAKGLGNKLKG